MPMQVRLNKLQDYCGVSVSTATLYNYLKKLTNLNYIITEKNDKYWYTTYKNKRKIQKSVENAEMENLCNKWLQDKKKYTNLGLSLNTIYSQLWLDYGYYFYCPNKITLNGFSIEETSELIETCYLIIGGVSV